MPGINSTGNIHVFIWILRFLFSNISNRVVDTSNFWIIMRLALKQIFFFHQERDIKQRIQVSIHREI